MQSQHAIQQAYQQAVQYHMQDQPELAERAYQRLLSQAPRHADAWHMLGVLYYQTDRAQMAIEALRKATRLTPNNADFRNNLGLCQRASGDHASALDSFLKACQLAPKDADIQTNLGNTFVSLGRLEEAAGCYRRVLHWQSHDPEIRQALVDALSGLGLQCQREGRYQQAADCYAEAMQYQPGSAALYYNLANAERALQRPAEAARHYQKALQLAPDDADIHNNYGNVLRELGEVEAAIAHYQTAIDVNPELHHSLVHLIHQRQHLCDWPPLAEEVARVRSWVGQVPQAQISPFAFLSMPGSTAQAQLQCASQWAQARLGALSRVTRPMPDVTNTPKLRIGYLSADFRLHPLASLISEVIELHDRNQFEVFAYDYSVPDGSQARQRLLKAFDRVVDITALGTQAAAQKIADDQIDILIDLTGFTQGSRTAIVACKPAQMHVNWLGFPGTMGSLNGAPLFDYVIGDPIVTPPEQAANFAEALVILPDSYQPNDRLRPCAPLPSRVDCYLPAQAQVLCCFNQTFKILPDVFAVWMELLRTHENCVLWLLDCHATAKKNLQREAEKHGVSSERMIFAPRVDMAAHLARLSLADLMLDTLPYNAHTTASDALWMGVPVLTLQGETFSARVAASLLMAVNLPDLITHHLADYAAKAHALLNHPDVLLRYKAHLGKARTASALFNTPAFVNHLEQAYRTMMQRAHCGMPPDIMDLRTRPVVKSSE